MFQVILLIYLVIYFGIYLMVSKMNKSYINSYTVNMAYSFVMQGCFLFIASFDGQLQAMYSSNILYIFVVTLIVGVLSQYIGYCIGYKRPVNVGFIRYEVSEPKSKLVLIVSMCIAITSFVLLGVLGIGLTEWIFNNRQAYISGRSGFGMYYILFEIFLVVAIVTAIYRFVKYKQRSYLPIICLLAMTYFTGSKHMMLGAVVTVFLFYDIFYKRIKIRYLIVIGALGFIAVNILLMVQSNTTIINYINADFYFNYIKLIEALDSGELKFFYGQLQFEHLLYGSMPRNIFKSKPAIFGISRLCAHFFGEESVLAGNTPSFGSYGTSYADFGIFGVAIIPFVYGMFYGCIEKSLRRQMVNRGATLFPMILYVLFFIIFIPIGEIPTLILLYVIYLCVKNFAYGNKKSRFLKRDCMIAKE